MRLYCMNVMECVCVCVCVCVSVCVGLCVCMWQCVFICICFEQACDGIYTFILYGFACMIHNTWSCSFQQVFCLCKVKTQIHGPIENTERRNDCELSMNDDTTIAADNVACENRSARPTSINGTQPKKEVFNDISLLANYEVCWWK